LNADVHRFQIEFEKLYRRFFQAGKKKRYAGHIIWKEGKDVDDIDITGFEYKRSDIAQITKEVQQNVIETIVTGDDIDEDLEEIKSYLVDVIARVLGGDMDLDEIGIPGGIGKARRIRYPDRAGSRGEVRQPHARDQLREGSKPKRLYIEKVHPDFWQRMEDEEGLDPKRDHLYGEFKTRSRRDLLRVRRSGPRRVQGRLGKDAGQDPSGADRARHRGARPVVEEVKTGQEQTGLGSFM